MAESAFTIPGYRELKSTLIRRDIAQLSVRIDGYVERREMLLRAISKGFAGVTCSEAVPNSHLLLGFLGELRDIEKQAAIELGQWTEKRDVKMDANINQRSEILAATFTLDELERMMEAGLQAVEQRQQQQQQPASARAIFQP